MSLTARQRENLRKQLGPLIKDAIDDYALQRGGVPTPEGYEFPGTNYLAKIQQGQNRGTHASGELPKGHAFAQVVRSYMATGGNTRDAIDLAHEHNFSDVVVRALEAGSAEGGGLLIPSPLADEVIELLRPRSVVRAALPRVITIPAGNLQFPRIESGSTATYVGENGEIAISELTTSGVNLLARKLAALTLISNDLLRFGASADVDQIILDDLLQAIATTEDIKLLFGSGVEAEPLGLVNQIDAANKFTANAVINLVNVRADLRTAEEKLRSANVPMLRPTWFMSPRSRLFLRDLTDTDDRPVFKEEVNAGRLNGMPLFSTNNILNNLGGGTESTVILVDMSEVILGQVASVEIARSDSAAINVGGTMQSIFQRDRSAIRTIMHNDVRLRHSVSGAVISAVTWGA